MTKKVMDVEEFAQYACKYASEIDCSITGKSLLALYERIEMMDEDGVELTKRVAEDLIEEAADKALKLIKVDYEVLEPLLDFTKALDNDIVVHPEGDVTFMFPQGGDVPRNLVCSGTSDFGDLDEAFAQSDIVFERTYTSQATQTAPMETFRAFATTDAFGRISVTTSTQVPLPRAPHGRAVARHSAVAGAGH